MNQTELETFIASLNNVQRTENFGYTFFFVGDDLFHPFVTFANADYEYDSVSNLNREGVFRINIGVSKTTFKALLSESGEADYTALNIFLPHPEYAKQYFLCILNPTGKNVEITKKLIEEAYTIAVNRLLRKAKRSPLA